MGSLSAILTISLMLSWRHMGVGVGATGVDGVQALRSNAAATKTNTYRGQERCLKGRLLPKLKREASLPRVWQPGSGAMSSC